MNIVFDKYEVLKKQNKVQVGIQDLQMLQSKNKEINKMKK